VKDGDKRCYSSLPPFACTTTQAQNLPPQDTTNKLKHDNTWLHRHQQHTTDTPQTLQPMPPNQLPQSQLPLSPPLAHTLQSTFFNPPPSPLLK
jgi:hypothetical protein